MRKAPWAIALMIGAAGAPGYAADTGERTYGPNPALCRERDAPPEKCVINDGPAPPPRAGGIGPQQQALTPVPALPGTPSVDSSRPQGRPADVTPSAPVAAPAPPAAVPATPQAALPTAPQSASPTTPQAALPTAPQNASPTTPQNAFPGAPQATAPTAPQNAAPSASPAAPSAAPQGAPPTARSVDAPARSGGRR